MKLKLLGFIVTVLGATSVNAQTYNMANGSISTCSGNFYDSGGSGGTYGNSQTFVYTFCSSTPGQSVSVNFSMFDLESGWDYLYIYDGNNTGAPLIGTYTGTGSPGVVTATNAGGCLTFRFTSDGSVTYNGWAASISCVVPPAPGSCAGAISMPASGNCTTCSSTLYDSGGAGGVYGNSENRTYTICPGTPGADIQAMFTSFDLENTFDYLYIYDGNSVGAPLIGTYSGATSPGTITASASNPTGCLTFRFTSDGSVTYTGFAAIISCINPCQTITPNIVSTNPAPDGDGTIRVCPNENINFVGNATFSTSGAGATYQWIMGDGTTVNGTNINDSYPTSGGYVAYLLVTDPMGCTGVSSEQIVEVSTVPVINTSSAPSSLCAYETSALSANVTMTPFNVNCTPPVSGTTFLPDGSGVSYSSDIFTDCYPPGATITSAADIINVCLDLEHSYLGDLNIVFSCPNGQSMVLKAYPGGGGTYLGNPIDDLVSGPGTPRTYCFTPGAGTLLVSGTTSTAGSPAGASINAGNYMPVQSFNNLIGCPLNGTWSITVTDNLFADDGYIFEWGFDLAASLSSVSSFTPTIVSQGWVANPDITPTGPTTANATPISTGTPCYTYQVTDNFGCTYTANECLTVGCTLLGAELIEFDANATDDGRVLINWITSMERDNTEFVVERFTPDKVWETLAIVPSQGDAMDNQYYQTFDNSPYLGINYYRLISEDMDGNESTSEIRSVHFASGLKYYPNPAQDQLTIIGLPKNTTELEMYDAFGRIVQTIRVLDPEMTLVDLKQLNAGVYQIRFEDKVLRFVKE